MTDISYRKMATEMELMFLGLLVETIVNGGDFD
jgi:hypothetical protein